MFAHISHKMSFNSFANKIDRIAIKPELIEMFLEENNVEVVEKVDTEISI